MLIYPAIDIRAGQVVRLHQGDFAQETQYPIDPLALATQYQTEGASWLHVVDLDGARSGVEQERPLLRRLVTATPKLRVQSGGGVRTRADFDALRDAGVRRVVIGSLYVREPDVVARWLEETTSEAFCLALDVRDRAGGWWVQTAGWRKDSDLALFDAIEHALTRGFRHFLVTDIGRDGTLTGPNLALYQELRVRFAHAQVQASGGVSSLADLAQLRALGVHGAIVGKALLEGRFTLPQALLETGEC